MNHQEDIPFVDLTPQHVDPDTLIPCTFTVHELSLLAHGQIVNHTIAEALGKTDLARLHMGMWERLMERMDFAGVPS